ncbi:hypothetical protein D9758_002878 [Tetrapyrgos nigripes]|uniref:Uncharacterized protein n=1 Tax=Tetrapyrgos nigripes TaxID=182062 RepID=A0A8H5GPT1_9AGAR|nr:hypothetical protein D9758_002878 [Tetrapyrgos nigripes]
MGTTTTTMATSTDPVAPLLQDAPIVIFFTHYLPAILSAISRPALALWHFVTWLIQTTTRPVLLPIPILAFVFAPVIVLGEILFDIFVATPYNVFVYVLDVLYPFYVFCGVACLVGLFIGLVARLAVLYATTLLLGEEAVPAKTRQNESRRSGKERRS